MVSRISTWAKRFGNCFFTLLVSPLLRFCVVFYSLLLITSKLPLPACLFPQPLFCRERKTETDKKSHKPEKNGNGRKWLRSLKKRKNRGPLSRFGRREKGGLSFTLFRVDRDTQNVLKIVFSTFSVFPRRFFLQGEKRSCFRHKVEKLPEGKKRG